MNKALLSASLVAAFTIGAVTSYFAGSTWKSQGNIAGQQPYPLVKHNDKAASIPKVEHRSPGGEKAIHADAQEVRSPQQQSFQLIKELYPDIYEYVLEEQQHSLLFLMFVELMYLDLDKALDILEAQDGVLRKKMTGRLVEDGMQVDAQKVLTWFAKQQGTMDKDDFQGFLYTALMAAAEVDPENTEAYIKLLTSDSEVVEVTNAMAEGWWKQGSDAAFAWLESLNVSDDVRRGIYTTLMNRYASENPEGAAEIFKGADVNTRSNLTVPLMQGLANTYGPDHAMSWALKEIKDPDLLAMGLHQLTSNSKTDPLKLLDVLSENVELTSGEAGSALMATVVDQVSSKNRKLMMDRMRDFPESMQASIVSNVASQWIAEDSNSAKNWLETLPSGQLYDTAAMDYVHMTFNKNPDVALSVAERMSNKERRYGALHYMISSAPTEQLASLQNKLNFDGLEQKARDELNTLLRNRQRNTALLIP